MGFPKQRGTVIVDVLVVLAVLGAAGWASKAFLFTDDKKNAKESSAATEVLLQAQEEQSASVAASVTSIGIANEKAPESPSKAFIEREVPEALALLPNAPESALKAAEERRLAVMAGRLEEANRLYVELREQNGDLVAARDAAIAKRIEADKVLLEAAKENAAVRLERTFIIGAAILLGLGWFTRARQSVPLATLGQHIGSAGRPIQLVRELDSSLSPSQQKVVQRHAKLNLPTDDE